MTRAAGALSVFQCESYKDFLKGFINGLKDEGRGEVTRMARALGVNPTLISQVLHGPKNLTLEQACELTTHLGLSAAESEHFLILVQWERAGTRKLRAMLEAKLSESRRNSLKLERHVAPERMLSETEKAIFYSSWVYSAVRLYSSIGTGRTLEEIAHSLDLPRSRVREILEFLSSTGLCIASEGRYRMGPQSTHLDATSPFAARNHLNWRLEAMKWAERASPTEELMFTAPVSISSADFAAVREMLVELVRRVSSLVRKSPAEQLAVLNIDWLKVPDRSKS